MTIITPFELNQEIKKLEEEKKGFEQNSTLAFRTEIAGAVLFLLAQQEGTETTCYVILGTVLFTQFMRILALREIQNIKKKIETVQKHLKEK